ncbi:cytochrome c oxidase assembly protein [Prauserella alba]|uniref:Cytochrome c oxidase assembly protein n=1 Tax=Prauserella alba TaxID=176898 RepID=A0ABN1VIT8_9PSEU|nr:cytochrome c oxidase assembly protein [Prauserella alba]MCP2182920.1 putative copper resistance protein D [Prauserella alba]
MDLSDTAVRRRPVPRGRLMLAGICGLAAVVAAAAFGGDVYGPVGDNDPGAPTSYGFVIVRYLAEGAAMVCGGALAFAAFVVPARGTGRIVADAYGAVRTAGVAGLVWTVGALLAVPLSAADSSGQPVRNMLSPSALAATVGAADEPTAWLVTATTATIVTALCRFALHWRTVVAACAIAMVGLLPPMVVGHAAVGAWHDVMTNALVWHVPAASAWLGAFVALLAHGHRRGGVSDVVLTRYDRLVSICVTVVGVSGVIAGLTGARPDNLTNSPYGLLLVGQAVVLTAWVGALVVVRRRRGSTGISRRRILTAEGCVLGISLGASVGLTHLVLPSFLSDVPSVHETILGYDLNLAPTLVTWLTEWRFDLVLGTFSVLAVAGYLAGAVRLRRRGDHWPAGRTVAWCLGWFAVLLATSSALGRYSPGSFSLHMVTHMTLNMLAPVLLVLGGPITLALRALPTSGRTRATGPREWLAALVHSRATRLLSHPVLAGAGFVGSFYVLYFSDLFGQAMLEHWGHQLMNIHFLISGYLFYWAAIGVDRSPRPLPPLVRLGMLFAVMPFHAFFAVIVMNDQTVIAETFYRYLSLPWVEDLLADQRLGGAIAWATGEIPMLIVVTALLTQWWRADQREARRRDRHGDDELAAYNAMLDELAKQRR